jgi:hypothetical protein
MLPRPVLPRLVLGFLALPLFAAAPASGTDTPPLPPLATAAPQSEPLDWPRARPALTPSHAEPPPRVAPKR